MKFLLSAKGFCGPVKVFSPTIPCHFSFLCGLFIFSGPLCEDCLVDRETSHSALYSEKELRFSFRLNSNVAVPPTLWPFVISNFVSFKHPAL